MQPWRYILQIDPVVHWQEHLQFTLYACLCPTFLRGPRPLSYLPSCPETSRVLCVFSSASRPLQPVFSLLIPAEARLTSFLPPIWPPFPCPHWSTLTSPSPDWLPNLSNTAHCCSPRANHAPQCPLLLTWQGSDASKWLVVFRSLPSSSHGALVRDECSSCRRRKPLCNYWE